MTTPEQIYNEYIKLSDSELNKVFGIYENAKKDLHQNVQQINELKAKPKLTKKEQDELKTLQEESAIIEEDLKQFKIDTDIAKRVLKERVQKRKYAVNTATTGLLSVATIIANQEQEKNIYKFFSSKSEQDLYGILHQIKSEKDEQEALLSKLKSDAAIFARKKRGWVNQNEYSAREKRYEELKAKELERNTVYRIINKILDDRGLGAVKEEEEAPKSVQQSTIAPTHLTDDVLKHLQSDIANKIHDYQEKIARLQLLDNLPADKKQEEVIKGEIERLAKIVETEFQDIDTVYDEFDLYKQELINRGIVKATTHVQTQTEHQKILLDQAREIIQKYPDLKDNIIKIMLSEHLKQGNVQKSDIETIRDLYTTVGQPVMFNPPISQRIKPQPNLLMRRPTRIEDYENLVPSTYAITVRF